MIAPSFSRNLRARALTAFALLCLVLPATAQSRYTAEDKSLSFATPDGWRVETAGGKLRLTAPNGSRYLLQHDTVFPIPTGDPAKSQEFQAAANKLAVPLLGNSEFLSARAVKVDSGAGAVFQFKEKVTGGRAADVAEVWLAVIGKRTAALLPEKPNQEEPTAGLESLWKTLAFADPNTLGNAAASATTGDAKRPGAQVKKPTPNPQAKNSLTNSDTTKSPANFAQKGQTGGRATSDSLSATLLEGYEGRLSPSDVAFTLRLMHDNTATATWDTGSGTGRFAGTYTGESGNYTVNLTRSSGDIAAKTLTLEMRASGGIETGRFSTDTASARRPIAELRLTELNINSRGKGKNLRNNRRATPSGGQNRPGLRGNRGRKTGFSNRNASLARLYGKQKKALSKMRLQAGARMRGDNQSGRGRLRRYEALRWAASRCATRRYFSFCSSSALCFQ